MDDRTKFSLLMINGKFKEVSCNKCLLELFRDCVGNKEAIELLQNNLDEQCEQNYIYVADYFIYGFLSNVIRNM